MLIRHIASSYLQCAAYVSFCLSGFAFISCRLSRTHGANIIPRLHDQAGSTSCYMLAGRASSMFAWWLLRVGYALCMLHISSMFARRLLDRLNGVLVTTVEIERNIVVNSRKQAACFVTQVASTSDRWLTVVAYQWLSLAYTSCSRYRMELWIVGLCPIYHGLLLRLPTEGWPGWVDLSLQCSFALLYTPHYFG